MKSREKLLRLILDNYTHFDYDKQRDVCVYCGGKASGGYMHTIRHIGDCVILDLFAEFGLKNDIP